MPHKSACNPSRISYSISSRCCRRQFVSWCPRTTRRTSSATWCGKSWTCRRSSRRTTKRAATRRRLCCCTGTRRGFVRRASWLARARRAWTSWRCREKHGASGKPYKRDPTRPLVAKMRRRLRRGGYRSRYRLRKQVVEPVFGQMKEAKGMRRFLLRGLGKVKSEWALNCIAHNLSRSSRKPVCSRCRIRAEAPRAPLPPARALTQTGS